MLYGGEGWEVVLLCKVFVFVWFVDLYFLFIGFLFIVWCGDFVVLICGLFVGVLIVLDVV